jgi:hypothetical protein
MLSPPSGNFSTSRGISHSDGMWMSGAAFRVLQSTTFSNFSSAHTIRHIVRLASFLCTVTWLYRTWYTSMHHRLNSSSWQYFRLALLNLRCLLWQSSGKTFPMWHHSIYSQQSVKIHGSGTFFQPLKANFSGF